MPDEIVSTNEAIEEEGSSSSAEEDNVTTATAATTADLLDLGKQFRFGQQ